MLDTWVVCHWLISSLSFRQIASQDRHAGTSYGGGRPMVELRLDVAIHAFLCVTLNPHTQTARRVLSSYLFKPHEFVISSTRWSKL